MAQLLVKARQEEGATGPGAYLRGHVVRVYPDGWEMGAQMGLPKFYVLEVPDDVVEDHPELAREELAGEELVRRRAWMLDVDALPPGIIVALGQTGRAQLTRGVLNAAVKRETRPLVGGSRGE